MCEIVLFLWHVTKYPVSKGYQQCFTSHHQLRRLSLSPLFIDFGRIRNLSSIRYILGPKSSWWWDKCKVNREEIWGSLALSNRGWWAQLTRRGPDVYSKKGFTLPKLLNIKKFSAKDEGEGRQPLTSYARPANLNLKIAKNALILQINTEDEARFLWHKHWIKVGNFWFGQQWDMWRRKKTARKLIVEWMRRQSRFCFGINNLRSAWAAEGFSWATRKHENNLVSLASRLQPSFLQKIPSFSIWYIVLCHSTSWDDSWGLSLLNRVTQF